MTKTNTKGAVVWGLLGFCIAFIMSQFFFELFSTEFWLVSLVTGIIFAFIGSKTKTKEEKEAAAAKKVLSQDGLSKKEFWQITAICIPFSVVAGSVIYYMWKAKYPKKAKQANNIAWVIFLIEMAVLWYFDLL